jgi:GDP-4-dehydro-6-deoxy-D-mannose reductase
MRVLVTGGNGFVGGHLCAALRARGDEAITAGHAHDLAEVDFPLDLCDLANVRGVLEAARPDAVMHLAAQTFVPAAVSDPLTSYDVNSMGTARLFEAIRLAQRKPRRVLFVSSAEVYGARDASAYPLRETLAPQPMTPYGASKIAGEAIALASARAYGIPTIVTRAFNHIGPGQNQRFSVASFAARLALIAEGGEPVMRVGNLTAQRDFLDVRDVAQAYVALLDRGEPGEIYNVCSGIPVSMAEVLRLLISVAHLPVEVREDPALLRVADTPCSYGDNAKLKATAAWLPKFTLRDSLRDVYADARARVSGCEANHLETVTP